MSSQKIAGKQNTLVIASPATLVRTSDHRQLIEGKKSKTRARPARRRLCEPKSSLQGFPKRDKLLERCVQHLRANSTLVERKSDSKGLPKQVGWVYDAETLAFARSLLSGKSEFHIRVVVNGSCPISSNVVSGAFGLSPRVSAEWSSIASLFDEYRVIGVRYTFVTALVAGNTGSNWIGGGFAIANDYNSSSTPSSYVDVLSHAESDFMPIAGGFVIGSTSTNATCLSQTKHVWHARPPRVVESAAAGTVATAEWLETGVDWPGSVLIYGGCNGTNSDVPLLYYTEFFAVLRQRR
jgi:hypothetical protein